MKSVKGGNTTCLLTFDQPLYVKACDIVAATDELSSVVIRLGGFHMLMSYMGSIGYTMNGSEMKEIWYLMYARNSVESMMTGHYYSRGPSCPFQYSSCSSSKYSSK